MARDSVNMRSESWSSCNQEPSESVSVKRPKEITILVESIENVDENKVKEVMVVVDFNENVLNQSYKIPIVKNRADIELNTFINAEEMSPKFINDILSNPILFTVLDTSPSPFGIASIPSPTMDKETKKRASKSSASPLGSKSFMPNNNVIGICNLDIGRLLAGERRIKETLLVEPENKVPPTEVVPWRKLPKLVVVASTGEEPLIPESSVRFNNIVGVTVESVYNLPNYISEGSVFEACIPMPSVGDKTNKLKFPNGVVTSTKDYTCRKKWMNLSHIEGPGARSKQRISLSPCDVISTLPEKENIEAHMEKSERMIRWSIWRNCLMYKADVNYFFSKIMKYRVWPIDIALPNKSKELIQKDKSAKSEKKSKIALSAITPSTDHFTAFLNLSPLLYPGTTKVRVAAQLMTYSPADLTTTFGSELAVFLFQSQTSVGTIKAKTASERSKASIRDFEENKDTPGVPVFNDEGAPTFIIVEIEFQKPFCPQKNLETVERGLKDFLSLQAKFKKKSTNLSITQNDFSQSIMEAIQILLQEYQKYSSPNTNENQQNSPDVKFHEFLSKQKNFYRIKTTLENKVVDLVKEKFGSLDNYEKKLPEIYIYLVNEMHKASNRFSLKENLSCVHFNDGELQLYADEAIEEGDFELAKNYLLLKLSRNTSNPNYWVDMATFYIRINKYEEAIEAVREALCLDFYHQIGLLMYALLMSKISNGAVAEMAFEILLSKYPTFIEGWMILRLFYLTLDNSEGAVIASQQAKTIACENKRRRAEPTPDQLENDEDEFLWKTYPDQDKYEAAREEKYGAGSFRNGISWAEPLSWTITICPPDNYNIKTTILLQKLGFYEFASMSLSKEQVSTEQAKPTPFFVYYTSVNQYLKGTYEDAILQLQDFTKEYGKDCFMWSLLGHCFYKLENHAKAIGCYEYVMQSYNRPDNIHLVYLRMGYYYLQANKFPCAKQVLMNASKYSATPKMWKGIGIACLMMEEIEDAEIAFGEANYLDNKDPDTWAYLAITNSMLGVLDLFQQCSTEAKKRGLKNVELMQKIKCCALINGLRTEEFEF